MNWKTAHKNRKRAEWRAHRAILAARLRKADRERIDRWFTKTMTDEGSVIMTRVHESELFPTPPAVAARMVGILEDTTIDVPSPTAWSVVGVLNPSPETTGIYECLCGNTRDFIGIDSRGYGGPEECTNAPECSDEDGCYEYTELRQPLTIIDGEVNYSAFEGGGPDSEIGNYTSIRCARPQCNQVIWKENETL